MRLIDADKLKEELSYKSPSTEFDIDSVILRVIDEQPTVNPWRRVGEEYPNENEYVLCRIPAFFNGDEPTYEVCQYYKGSRMYGDFIQEDKCMGDVIYQNPSHWMPIEPPKEGA